MTLNPDIVAGQIALNMIQNAILDTLKVSIIPMLRPALRTSWSQVRFPRSKKKRIRKKWAKNQRNWGMVTKRVELYKRGGPFPCVIPLVTKDTLVPKPATE